MLRSIVAPFKQEWSKTFAPWSYIQWSNVEWKYKIVFLNLRLEGYCTQVCSRLVDDDTDRRKAKSHQQTMLCCEGTTVLLILSPRLKYSMPYNADLNLKTEDELQYRVFKWMCSWCRDLKKPWVNWSRKMKPQFILSLRWSGGGRHFSTPRIWTSLRASWILTWRRHCEPEWSDKERDTCNWMQRCMNVQGVARVASSILFRRQPAWKWTSVGHHCTHKTPGIDSTEYVTCILFCLELVRLPAYSWHSWTGSNSLFG